MASLIIRKLDDAVKSRLRIRAAHNGRSMEEEAREILKAGLVPGGDHGHNIADSIRRRVAPLRGVELALPSREPVRRPPRLTK